jgi:putative ABC transport system ATP-binding protein
VSRRAVISLRDLSKDYQEGGRRVPVLSGVNLEVEAGEHLAIVGRSGSGKTTLLNLLGALDRDYEGHLVVDGQELKRLDDRHLAAFRNSTVGFVYQSFHLLPHLSAAQNVALPAFFERAAERGAPSQRERALECLERVGLRGQEDRFPLHLSGGERQRVAIARALFQRPRIILCDEPTGSLDEGNGGLILDLFEELNSELGVTLIVVTHDAKIAARAGRVVTVEGGTLVVREGAGQ